MQTYLQRGARSQNHWAYFDRLMHHLFKFGARACFIRNSPAGVIAPRAPSIIKPDALPDTQSLAPAGARRAGEQLVEGICSLTWLPLDRQTRAAGRIGNVQLDSGLLAVRSGGEAL